MLQDQPKITVTSTKTTIMIGLQHNLKNGKVKLTYSIINYNGIYKS